VTTIIRLILSFAVALSSGAAMAQGYPTKPIRMVVPWPPGGVTDVLARAVVQQMGESMGQQVFIENRPGAGGTIGVGLVAKAAPDGYTVLMTDISSHAISATLYSKLAFDVIKDFEPIAMVAGSPMVLSTSPALKVKTVREFIDLARSRKGQLAYGSSGNGSITHLAMERFKRMAGIEMLHVPYKGTVPAIASVLTGDSAVAFGTIPGVVPFAKAGKLVLLGGSFATRFPQIPDVPAIAETIPGYDMGFYTGLYAPAKTPRDFVDRLYAETMKALAHPKTLEIFAGSAAEPGHMTTAQFQEYMASEVRAWGEVVKAVGLKVD